MWIVLISDGKTDSKRFTNVLKFPQQTSGRAVSFPQCLPDFAPRVIEYFLKARKEGLPTLPCQLRTIKTTTKINYQHHFIKERTVLHQKIREMIIRNKMGFKMNKLSLMKILLSVLFPQLTVVWWKNCLLETLRLEHLHSLVLGVFQLSFHTSRAESLPKQFLL